MLREREDWRVHTEECGVITSLPILFENMVVEVLLTLKEIVIENRPGETEVSWGVISVSALTTESVNVVFVIFYPSPPLSYTYRSRGSHYWMYQLISLVAFWR